MEFEENVDVANLTKEMLHGFGYIDTIVWVYPDHWKNYTIAPIIENVHFHKYRNAMKHQTYYVTLNHETNTFHRWFLNSSMNQETDYFFTKLLAHHHIQPTNEHLSNEYTNAIRFDILVLSLSELSTYQWFTNKHKNMQHNIILDLDLDFFTCHDISHGILDYFGWNEQNPNNRKIETFNRLFEHHQYKPSHMHYEESNHALVSLMYHLSMINDYNYHVGQQHIPDRYNSDHDDATLAELEETNGNDVIEQSVRERLMHGYDVDSFPYSMPHILDSPIDKTNVQIPSILDAIDTALKDEAFLNIYDIQQLFHFLYRFHLEFGNETILQPMQYYLYIQDELDKTIEKLLDTTHKGEPETLPRYKVLPYVPEYLRDASLLDQDREIVTFPTNKQLKQWRLKWHQNMARDLGMGDVMLQKQNQLLNLNTDGDYNHQNNDDNNINYNHDGDIWNSINSNNNQREILSVDIQNDGETITSKLNVNEEHNYKQPATTGTSTIATTTATIDTTTTTTTTTSTTSLRTKMHQSEPSRMTSTKTPNNNSDKIIDLKILKNSVSKLTNKLLKNPFPKFTPEMLDALKDEDELYANLPPTREMMNNITNAMPTLEPSENAISPPRHFSNYTQIELWNLAGELFDILENYNDSHKVTLNNIQNYLKTNKVHPTNANIGHMMEYLRMQEDKLYTHDHNKFQARIKTHQRMRKDNMLEFDNPFEFTNSIQNVKFTGYIDMLSLQQIESSYLFKEWFDVLQHYADRDVLESFNNNNDDEEKSPFAEQFADQMARVNKLDPNFNNGGGISVRDHSQDELLSDTMFWRDNSIYWVPKYADIKLARDEPNAGEPLFLIQNEMNFQNHPNVNARIKNPMNYDNVEIEQEDADNDDHDEDNRDDDDSKINKKKDIFEKRLRAYNLSYITDWDLLDPIQQHFLRKTDHKALKQFVLALNFKQNTLLQWFIFCYFIPDTCEEGYSPFDYLDYKMQQISLHKREQFKQRKLKQRQMLSADNDATLDMPIEIDDSDIRTFFPEPEYHHEVFGMSLPWGDLWRLPLMINKEDKMVYTSMTDNEYGKLFIDQVNFGLSDDWVPSELHERVHYPSKRKILAQMNTIMKFLKQDNINLLAGGIELSTAHVNYHKYRKNGWLECAFMHKLNHTLRKFQDKPTFLRYKTFEGDKKFDHPRCVDKLMYEFDIEVYRHDDVKHMRLKGKDLNENRQFSPHFEYIPDFLTKQQMNERKINQEYMAKRSAE